MPIIIVSNYSFPGVSREEFDAFTTGIYITLDSTPDSYAQEIAARDNYGSLQIRSQRFCPFTSELIDSLFKIGPDPPIV